jgi:hypothetical protein
MALIPFRLLIQQRLTDRLKTITPANGYVCDLSDTEVDDVDLSRVHRGRDSFGFGDPLDMVSIREHPKVLEQTQGTTTSSSRTGEWEMLFQGFVRDDPENPTDRAHYLACDVVKALMVEKAREDNILGFGGRKPCVTDIRIGAYAALPADGEVSDVAFFIMPVTLVLVEDLSAPFIST